MLRAVQFGFQTGLRVPELCLGTINFGIPGRGHQGDWTLDYKEAKIFEVAIENGLLF